MNNIIELKERRVILSDERIEQIKDCLKSYSKYSKLFIEFFENASIDEFSYIDYSLRKEFSEMLECRKYNDKLKRALISCFDNIKLESIEKENKLIGKITAENKYFKQDEVFLLYYPVINIAVENKKVLDKKGLLYWNFKGIDNRLKMQIVNTIIFINENYKTGERGEKLYKLKCLMDYCSSHYIYDIGRMDLSDKCRFNMFLNSRKMFKNTWDIIDMCIWVVEHKEKYFDFSKELWYLDAMNLNDDRKNAARPIKRFDFRDISNSKNRDYCKEYIEYLLGLTDTAISTIREILCWIKEMAIYFSDREMDLLSITQEDMRNYTDMLSDQKIDEQTYNVKVDTIIAFFRYMEIKHTINKEIFKELYHKFSYEKKIERPVKEETIRMILKDLYKDDMTLYVMYLILLETGLRINEVCTLKANCLNENWLTVYQPKMKTEKMLPLSNHLSKKLEKYIEENTKDTNEYVFRNINGEAYNAGTFSKKMVNFCKRHGISCEKWIFRAHDYRHHITTCLYKDGVDSNTIREWLGHTSINMTKRYMDGLDDEIIMKQREFFGEV